jgi:hypothetical protein
VKLGNKPKSFNSNERLVKFLHPFLEALQSPTSSPTKRGVGEDGDNCLCPRRSSHELYEMVNIDANVATKKNFEETSEDDVNSLYKISDMVWLLVKEDMHS